MGWDDVDSASTYIHRVILDGSEQVHSFIYVHAQSAACDTYIHTHTHTHTHTVHTHGFTHPQTHSTQHTPFCSDSGDVRHMGSGVCLATSSWHTLWYNSYMQQLKENRVKYGMCVLAG